MFAWNSAQNILGNWSFKNSTANRMKYFVAKCFAENFWKLQTWSQGKCKVAHSSNK